MNSLEPSIRLRRAATWVKSSIFYAVLIHRLTKGFTRRDLKQVFRDQLVSEFTTKQVTFFVWKPQDSSISIEIHNQTGHLFARNFKTRWLVLEFTTKSVSFSAQK